MAFEVTELEKKVFEKAYKQNRIHFHEDEYLWHLERMEYLAKWHPNFKCMQQLIDAVYPIGFGYCSDNKLWSLMQVAHDEYVKAGNEPEHKVDIYIEYDVLFHHCINMKQRTVAQVYKYVLDNVPAGLFDEMDYFSIARTPINTPSRDFLWPKFRWVSVYYVTGGSEGYYLHVDTIGEQDGGRDRRMMLLGKTLLKGKAGRDYMAKVCKVLSEILWV